MATPHDTSNDTSIQQVFEHLNSHDQELIKHYFPYYFSSPSPTFRLVLQKDIAPPLSPTPHEKDIAPTMSDNTKKPTNKKFYPSLETGAPVEVNLFPEGSRAAELIKKLEARDYLRDNNLIAPHVTYNSDDDPIQRNPNFAPTGNGTQQRVITGGSRTARNVKDSPIKVPALPTQKEQEEDPRYIRNKDGKWQRVSPLLSVPKLTTTMSPVWDKPEHAEMRAKLEETIRQFQMIKRVQAGADPVQVALDHPVANAALKAGKLPLDALTEMVGLQQQFQQKNITREKLVERLNVIAGRGETKKDNTLEGQGSSSIRNWEQFGTRTQFLQKQQEMQPEIDATIDTMAKNAGLTDEQRNKLFKGKGMTHDQYKFVKSDANVQVQIAGPGGGKTYEDMLRLAYLKQHGTHIEKFLFTAPTHGAVNTFRNRMATYSPLMVDPKQPLSEQEPIDWNDPKRDRQFRTPYSTAMSYLHTRHIPVEHQDEEGNPYSTNISPMDYTSNNWSYTDYKPLGGEGMDVKNAKTLGDLVNATDFKEAQDNYIQMVLDKYGAGAKDSAKKLSRSKVKEYINTIKGQRSFGSTYAETFKQGKETFDKSGISDDPSAFYAYEQSLHMAQKDKEKKTHFGVKDQKSPKYDLMDSLYMARKAANIPGAMKYEGVVGDEEQDNPPEAFAMFSAMTNEKSHVIFTGDPSQKNIYNTIDTTKMVERAFDPEKSKNHAQSTVESSQLTATNRLSPWNAAFIDALQSHPAMKNVPKSPYMVSNRPIEEGYGEMPELTHHKTLAESAAYAMEKHFEDTGMSWEKLGENVKEKRAPYTGATGARAPEQNPIVFMTHDRANRFGENVRAMAIQNLGEELGSDVHKQMFSTKSPSEETQSKLHAILTSQVRSNEYEGNVTFDATHDGGWNELAAVIAQRYTMGSRPVGNGSIRMMTTSEQANANSVRRNNEPDAWDGSWLPRGGYDLLQATINNALGQQNIPPSAIPQNYQMLAQFQIMDEPPAPMYQNSAALAGVADFVEMTNRQGFATQQVDAEAAGVLQGHLGFGENEDGSSIPVPPDFQTFQLNPANLAGRSNKGEIDLTKTHLTEEYLRQLAEGGPDQLKLFGLADVPRAEDLMGKDSLFLRNTRNDTGKFDKDDIAQALAYHQDIINQTQASLSPEELAHHQSMVEHLSNLSPEAYDRTRISEFEQDPASPVIGTAGHIIGHDGKLIRYGDELPDLGEKDRPVDPDNEEMSPDERAAKFKHNSAYYQERKARELASETVRNQALAEAQKKNPHANIVDDSDIHPDDIMRNHAFNVMKSPEFRGQFEGREMLANTFNHPGVLQAAHRYFIYPGIENPLKESDPQRHKLLSQANQLHNNPPPIIDKFSALIDMAYKDKESPEGIHNLKSQRSQEIYRHRQHQRSLEQSAYKQPVSAKVEPLIRSMVMDPTSSTYHKGFAEHMWNAAAGHMADKNLTTDTMDTINDVVGGIVGSSNNDPLNAHRMSELQRINKQIQTGFAPDAKAGEDDRLLDRGIEVTPEYIAHLRKQDPRKSAELEHILKNFAGGLLSLKEAKKEIKARTPAAPAEAAQYVSGKNNTLSNGHDLYSRAERGRAPFTARELNLRERLNNPGDEHGGAGGIVDPNAGQMHEGTGQFVPNGSLVRLYAYEARLRDQITNAENPQRSGKVTPQHLADLTTNYAHVKNFRKMLNNPRTTEQSGHFMNIVGHAVYGKRPSWDHLSKEERAQREAEHQEEPIDHLFQHLENRFKAGTYTMEGMSNYYSAQSTAMQHMQKTGTIQRGHLYELLKSMGHDPQDETFRGLSALEKNNSFVKEDPKAYSKPTDAVSLDALAHQYKDVKDEKNKPALMQELYGQFTRFPMRQDEEVTFNSDPRGAVQKGMQKGMTGTLGAFPDLLTTDATKLRDQARAGKQPDYTGYKPMGFGFTADKAVLNSLELPSDEEKDQFQSLYHPQKFRDIAPGTPMGVPYMFTASDGTQHPVLDSQVAPTSDYNRMNGGGEQQLAPPSPHVNDTEAPPVFPSIAELRAAETPPQLPSPDMFPSFSPQTSIPQQAQSLLSGTGSPSIQPDLEEQHQQRHMQRHGRPNPIEDNQNPIALPAYQRHLLTQDAHSLLSGIQPQMSQRKGKLNTIPERPPIQLALDQRYLLAKKAQSLLPRAQPHSDEDIPDTIELPSAQRQLLSQDAQSLLPGMHQEEQQRQRHGKLNPIKDLDTIALPSGQRQLAQQAQSLLPPPARIRGDRNLIQAVSSIPLPSDQRPIPHLLPTRAESTLTQPLPPMMSPHSLRSVRGHRNSIPDTTLPIAIPSRQLLSQQAQSLQQAQQNQPSSSPAASSASTTEEETQPAVVTSSDEQSAPVRKKSAPSPGHFIDQDDPATSVGANEPPQISDLLATLHTHIMQGHPDKDKEIYAPSEEQMGVYKDPELNRIIKGGAGGGKTTTLIGASMKQVASGTVLPKNILSLSGMHSGRMAIDKEQARYEEFLPTHDDNYRIKPARTYHSLAHSMLFANTKQHDDGSVSYPNLEDIGFHDFSGTVLMSHDDESTMHMNPEARLVAHKLSQDEYLKKTLNKKNGQGQYYNTDDMNFAEMLKDIGTWKKGRKPNEEGMYEQAYRKGESQRADGEFSHQVGLVEYQEALQRDRTMDMDDYFHFGGQVLDKKGFSAIPNDLKDVEHINMDEVQDKSEGSLSFMKSFKSSLEQGGNKVSTFLGLDEMQSLMQDMGGLNLNEVMGKMKSWLGLQNKEHHSLTTNFRSDARAVALNNSILQHDKLKNEAKGDPQVPMEGGALGEKEKFVLAKTQPTLYRKMFKSMLDTIGVSPKTIAENIMHPDGEKKAFEGVQWKQLNNDKKKTVNPSQVPAIFTMRRQQELFEREAKEVLKQEGGLSEEKATQVINQIMRRDVIGKEHPNKELYEQAKNQFSILRTARARSLSFISPHVDVTRGGWWILPGDDKMQGYLRNVYTGISRVASGGRNAIFAASRPFSAKEHGQYMKIQNPEQFEDQYADNPKNGAIMLNGNQLTQRQGDVNEFQTFQGETVPNGFGGPNGFLAKQASQLSDWQRDGIIPLRSVADELRAVSSPSPVPVPVPVPATTVASSSSSGISGNGSTPQRTVTAQSPASAEKLRKQGASPQSRGFAQIAETQGRKQPVSAPMGTGTVYRPPVLPIQQSPASASSPQIEIVRKNTPRTASIPQPGTPAKRILSPEDIEDTKIVQAELKQTELKRAEDIPFYANYIPEELQDEHSRWNTYNDDELKSKAESDYRVFNNATGSPSMRRGRFGLAGMALLSSAALQKRDKAVNRPPTPIPEDLYPYAHEMEQHNPDFLKSFVLPPPAPPSNAAPGWDAAAAPPLASDFTTKQYEIRSDSSSDDIHGGPATRGDALTNRLSNIKASYLRAKIVPADANAIATHTTSMQNSYNQYVKGGDQEHLRVAMAGMYAIHHIQQIQGLDQKNWTPVPQVMLDAHAQLVQTHPDAVKDMPNYTSGIPGTPGILGNPSVATPSVSQPIVQPQLSQPASAPSVPTLATGWATEAPPSLASDVFATKYDQSAATSLTMGEILTNHLKNIKTNIVPDAKKIAQYTTYTKQDYDNYVKTGDQKSLVHAMAGMYAVHHMQQEQGIPQQNWMPVPQAMDDAHVQFTQTHPDTAPLTPGYTPGPAGPAGPAASSASAASGIPIGTSTDTSTIIPTGPARKNTATSSIIPSSGTSTFAATAPAGAKAPPPKLPISVQQMLDDTVPPGGTPPMKGGTGGLGAGTGMAGAITVGTLTITAGTVNVTGGGKVAGGSGGGEDGNGPPKKPTAAQIWNNNFASAGHSIARVGSEFQFIGQNLTGLGTNALKQGSEYRLATLGQNGSGKSGTDGFFDFSNMNGGINAFSHSTLPMYSNTQVAQGMKDLNGMTNTQFSPQKPGQTLGPLTDMMGLAAVTGMDPTSLMSQMTGAAGWGGGGPASTLQRTGQMTGMLTNLYGTNLTSDNVGNTMSALNTILPTLQGLNNTTNTDQTGQAMSFFKLANQAGMTTNNLGSVSQMMGGLAGMGSTPNLQQQYQLSQLLPQLGTSGQPAQLTAAPELANYQAQQNSAQNQIAQLNLQQNIGNGQSLPQLNIQISQAQITMDKAQLDMSGFQQQYNQAQYGASVFQQQYSQAQYGASSFQQQYAQAQFGQSQYQQNQLYGPIGADVSRTAYYSLLKNQQAAQYNGTSPESATNYTPAQTFGLKNEEFYSGMEHQRSQLVLGRSPLLSDMAFQDNLKNINQQEDFYKQELALQNQQRAFDKDWQQRNLNVQQTMLEWQKKQLDVNQTMLGWQKQQLDKQAGILAIQQQQFGLEAEQAVYQQKQDLIQNDYLKTQTSDLQNISKAMGQQLTGQGPINGQQLQPAQIIQALADKYKNNDPGLQKAVEGSGLGSQDQATLLLLTRQLQKDGGNMTKLTADLNNPKNANDKQLNAVLKQGVTSGAFATQQQVADLANAFLQFGGTKANWTNLLAANALINTSINILGNKLAGQSGPALLGGTITNIVGQVAMVVASVLNVLGIVKAASIITKLFGAAPAVAPGGIPPTVGGAAPTVGTATTTGGTAADAGTAAGAGGGGGLGAVAGPVALGAAAIYGGWSTFNQKDSLNPGGQPWWKTGLDMVLPGFGVGNQAHSFSDAWSDPKYAKEKFGQAGADQINWVKNIPGNIGGLWNNIGGLFNHKSSTDPHFRSNNTSNNGGGPLLADANGYGSLGPAPSQGSSSSSSWLKSADTLFTKTLPTNLNNWLGKPAGTFFKWLPDFLINQIGKPAWTFISKTAPDFLMTWLGKPAWHLLTVWFPDFLWTWFGKPAWYLLNTWIPTKFQDWIGTPFGNVMTWVKTKFNDWIGTPFATLTNKTIPNIFNQILNVFTKTIPDFFAKTIPKIFTDALNNIFKSGSSSSSGGNSNLLATFLKMLGGSAGGTPIGSAPSGHPGFVTPHVNQEYGVVSQRGTHRGVDFAADQGTPIGEFIGGKVKSTGHYDWGGEVDVTLPDGLTERYIHLSAIGVKPGDKLKKGDFVGLSGGGTPESGLGWYSSGSHLHYQTDFGTYENSVSPWTILSLYGDTNIMNDFNIIRSRGAASAGAGAGKAGGAQDRTDGRMSIGGGTATGGYPGIRSSHQFDAGEKRMHLYQGGIAMTRMKAEIAEQEPEAVIPISKLTSVLQSTFNQTNVASTTTNTTATTSSGKAHVALAKIADNLAVHVHTTAQTLDARAQDDLMAQLLDIFNTALREYNGKLN